ncbi:MAG: dockerin type I domain-containing protein [Euryarchaeota archaeon]|nr:dockerin type I domain-containing protein [Euryarchaeota archaeon]
MSLRCDPNRDNYITPADATIALAFADRGSTSCDSQRFIVADVSGDGQVTSLDALIILQMAEVPN